MHELLVELARHATAAGHRAAAIDDVHAGLGLQLGEFPGRLDQVADQLLDEVRVLVHVHVEVLGAAQHAGLPERRGHQADDRHCIAQLFLQAPGDVEHIVRYALALQRRVPGQLRQVLGTADDRRQRGRGIIPAHRYFLAECPLHRQIDVGPDCVVGEIGDHPHLGFHEFFPVLVAILHRVAQVVHGEHAVVRQDRHPVGLLQGNCGVDAFARGHAALVVHSCLRIFEWLTRRVSCAAGSGRPPRPWRHWAHRRPRRPGRTTSG